jgi:hypothetical protein
MKPIDNSEVPAEPASVSEYVNKTEKIIKRTKHILTKKLEDRKNKYRNIYFDKLLESIKPSDVITEIKR